ncbi:hypothetical protein PtB15_9B372 [Puccinia triticina]|nr:hypothetical protein PtB15_9B372 [Puccinia triticina]
MAPIRNPRLKLPARKKRTKPPEAQAVDSSAQQKTKRSFGQTSLKSQIQNKIGKQVHTLSSSHQDWPERSDPSESEDDNDQRSDPGGEKNSDLDDRSPDIDPVIDMWDREFRQNHSAGIPGLQPNSGIGNQPEEQSQALTLAEVNELRKMTTLDDSHFREALKVLKSPNTAIAFLVLKELERTQNSSEPRYGSNDPPPMRRPEKTRCTRHWVPGTPDLMSAYPVPDPTSWI